MTQQFLENAWAKPFMVLIYSTSFSFINKYKINQFSFNYKLFINLSYTARRKPSKSEKVGNRALVSVS